MLLSSVYLAVSGSDPESLTIYGAWLDRIEAEAALPEINQTSGKPAAILTVPIGGKQFNNIINAIAAETEKLNALPETESANALSYRSQFDKLERRQLQLAAYIIARGQTI